MYVAQAYEAKERRIETREVKLSAPPFPKERALLTDFTFKN
jgi:hypothetical protein